MATLRSQVLFYSWKDNERRTESRKDLETVNEQGSAAEGCGRRMEKGGALIRL